MLSRRTTKSRTGITKAALLAMLAVVAPARARNQSVDEKASREAAPRPLPKPDPGPSADYHEDWAKLTLEGSNLVAQPPVLGEQDDAKTSTFIRQRYQMQWRPDDPLDLFVVRPKGVAKSPVILYLYSFPQDTERFKDDAWCRTATNGGFAAVGFVSAFTGHRMEHQAVKRWFVSEFQQSIGESVHDVQMILNYLEGRGDLDMQRVGMFGQGSGGSIAILASAADPRIKFVDVLTPWGDWPAWLATSKLIPEDERATYLKPEFLARAAKVEPLQWLPKVKAQDLRLQDVRLDDQMSDAAELKMEAAAPETSEIDKYGDPPALLPHVGRLLDWLKQKLGPDSNVSSAELKTDRVRYYPPRGKAGPPLPLPAASAATSGKASQP